MDLFKVHRSNENELDNFEIIMCLNLTPVNLQVNNVFVCRTKNVLSLRYFPYYDSILQKSAI